MYGFRISHEFGAWGSGFDNLVAALEAAIEEASSLKGAICIYLTHEGEIIASFWLA